MIIVKLFMKGSSKMIDFSGYECTINVIQENIRMQMEGSWRE